MSVRQWGWGAERLAHTDDYCDSCGSRDKPSQGARWLHIYPDGRLCSTCAHTRWETSQAAQVNTNLPPVEAPAVIPGQLDIFGGVG